MCALALLLPLAFLLPQEGPGTGGHEVGFASIEEKDLFVHVSELASPELEGRDSPSDGLLRAGDYLIERLKAAGFQPGVGGASFRQNYTVKRMAPVAGGCLLAAKPKDGDEFEFTLEKEFVPLPHATGEAEGTLSFYGYGITESGERYDDLHGKNMKGEVVMILEGEPRSKKLFDGPEVTKAADVYSKLKALEERGARGVLVVRRPPEPSKGQPRKGFNGRVIAPTEIGFRHTWASWVNREDAAHSATLGIPALEIDLATATKLLGEDVGELAAKIDSTGKPVRRQREDLFVTLKSGVSEQLVPIDNIVGILPGADAALAKEMLVLGAHYDHIGVDARGRIGCGADDNGSGSAGLVELAEAFALSKPKRSIVCVWFSAEEDGLVGSEEFCARPPIDLSLVVAMLNVDMIGRCAEDEAYVIGTHFNPALEDVLKDAKKLKPTQLKKVFTDKGLDLWERSDQAAFHRKGIPALFFTEGAIDAENPDYHTFDDTVDKLSLTKMARITRLMFNLAWLIAEAPERPPKPR
jgi:hypothetical protein